jgi:hypothetical protein
MMTERQRNLLYYGTSQPPSEPQTLAAGLLSVDFVDGGLRNIRYDGEEVLRAIAYVVRDKDWGSYAPAILDLRITLEPGAFHIRYRARCDGEHGQSLTFSVGISGNEHGLLRFDAAYDAATDFLTCRNGFCVLHPSSLAGRPVSVRHSGGAVEADVFPDAIAPWQPFQDIQAIGHQVAPGVDAYCAFEGGVFEMEDQRNWSDASYKTYVRPLALPWPYVIPGGELGRQAVELRIGDKRGATAGVPRLRPGPIRLSLAPGAGMMPLIGLALAPDDCAAALPHLDELRALAPQRLLCHFNPLAGHGREALAAYAALAAAYPADYVLECVVPGVAAPRSELAEIARQLDEAGFRPDGLAVCPAVYLQSYPPGSAWPECPPLADIYDEARAAFPGVALGGGMFSYYTELNRKRPPHEKLDWVTHATNPIVHAADDASVMQTLEAIPHITRSCRTIIGADTPYCLGPITLGMRQNPYGSRTMDNPGGGRVPMASDDPRARGLFGAAWLLGYAAQAVPAGPRALVFGPLTGERGLIGPPPEATLAARWQRYPAFRVARALAAMAGATPLACDSSAPGKLLALGAIDAEGAADVWVANLSDEAQVFRCELAPALGPLRIEAADAGGAELTIQPYSCLHLRAVPPQG